MVKRVADDRSQAVQRVRVGMIGLAAVILLIGLASVIFSGVRTDRARTIAGGGNSAVVANMAAPDIALNELNEPLVDLGVAPGVASVNAAEENGVR
jgi:hypothetical protein